MIQIVSSTEDTANGVASQIDPQSLSSVWHELRSPLGCIKGYANSLLALPGLIVDETVARQCLTAILEASAEIEELVDQLLDLTEISARTFRIDVQSVLLLPLVQSAAQRSSLRVHDRPIVLDMPPHMPLVRADPRRLVQVLDNLIDNASKYATTGPITVSAELIGPEVQVSVVDQGPGIPSEELDSIFDHFQRGRIASDRRIRGSGVGLALCRGIIEAHGGRIWAESAVNGHTAGDTSPGAAVRFTLATAVDTTARPRHVQSLGVESVRSKWHTNGVPLSSVASMDRQNGLQNENR
jgi:two-component system, OmpR family, sensor histidine kinase KdpD